MRDLIWAKKSPLQLLELKRAKVLAMTYSSTLLCAVPSAMKGLTSEFEMGSGGPPSPLSPTKSFLVRFTYYSLTEGDAKKKRQRSKDNKKD